MMRHEMLRLFGILASVLLAFLVAGVPSIAPLPRWPLANPAESARSTRQASRRSMCTCRSRTRPATRSPASTRRRSPCARTARTCRSDLNGGAAPISVVLVIDQSGSMATGGKLDAAKNAAHTFLKQLKDQDKVAVVAFNGQAHLLTPLSSDRQQAASLVDALSADGGTALYDGTARSLDLCGSVPGPQGRHRAHRWRR